MIDILKQYAPSWFKRVVKQAIGNVPAGRNVAVREGDVFIVSYPKSGNTWTRFLIGNLIYKDGVDFSNIEERVPDIYVNSDAVMGKLPSPRILKSHEYFDPRYKKVIYIVRDPRDVVVSYWHFAKKQKKISERVTLDSFVDYFIQGSLDGYGTWGEHVGSWLGSRGGSENMLLLKYEDMLIDTEEELRKVARFVGLCPDAERIYKAREMSSFENMKVMEKQQSQLWKSIRKSRQDIPFVRSGKSGSWNGILSERALVSVNNAWGATMEKLGYK